MGILYLNSRANPPVPPLYYDDPKGVIQKQMGNNERESIYQIGYDLDLTFANYPDLTIVNTSSLKLIENDLLRSEAGPNGEDVLYDEQIVGRILRFNSSWVNYRNWNDSLVFSSVQEGSEAEAKLNELGAGSMVSYQQLTLGEIRRSGKNYYILAMTSYTLIKDGRMDTLDSLFVYKLTASSQKNTMIIVDFEQIPLSALPTPLQNDPTTPPDTAPTGEQTNEPSDGQNNQTDGTQGQDTGQTNEPSTETESESGNGDGTGADSGTGAGTP
jgi:hypothetical protein